MDLNRPLKVVCLGNSITRHGYLPDVEWYSDWGMAASKPENDYCHILERELRRYDPKTTVTPLNIYAFENNPECDIYALAGEVCSGADVIVLRISENVHDVEAFEKNIGRLVEFCDEITPYVVISGPFWPNERNEMILCAVADYYKKVYVPLSWIVRMDGIYPSKGDTLYDIEGKPYTITKDFIITHPNDKGMNVIAQALLRAIKRLSE